MKKIYYLILLSVFSLPCMSLAEVARISNPISANSIQELIDLVLKAALAIGVPIAVLFLMYSGFKFITAQGDPGKVKDARQYFMWTLVGIVVLLGASLLSTIIQSTIHELGAGVL